MLKKILQELNISIFIKLNSFYQKLKSAYTKTIILISKNYQKNRIQAFIFSSLNKIFDIMPEILISIAIENVVNKEKSMFEKLIQVNNYQF